MKVYVGLGTSTITFAIKEGHESEMSVSKVIIHPGWSGDKKMPFIDMALIRLRDAKQFWPNPSYRVIFLPILISNIFGPI